ncbi:MAG: tyrosine-type recombinase/integrase [Aureliella sp.]
MTDSTEPAKSRRPRKSDFPLQVHKASGYWCKSCKGRRIYFEQVKNDPNGQRSLQTWLDQRDDLLAGRRPASKDAKRIKDLCNHWLTHKQNKLKSGELSQRSFDEYKATTDFVVAQLGSNRAIDNVDSDDFAAMRVALAKQYGPNGLSKRIQQVRSLFKHGWESGLLGAPAKYGPGFEKPTAKVMRQHRIAKGRQDFTAAEVQEMLRHARPNIRAMLLLGVQAGLGNTDIAELPLSAVNLETGWVDYPRAKTATHRRFKLWPETVAAIQTTLAIRPEVNSELLFISARGNDYTDAKRNGYRIAGDFVQVTEAAKITGKRGFYCLRRTFQTQAEEARDLVAVQAVMGHISTERDMSARYRQSISDERLSAVAEVVRQWLLPIPAAMEVG